MFAYSTIAQSGYIIIGLAVVPGQGDLAYLGIGATLMHLGVHLFMKGGAFMAVGSVADEIGYDIKDYAGLRKRAPWTASFMLIFLISLAGIVPTAGFVSKIFLLLAAIKGGPMGITLVITLGVNSVISFIYYGRLIRYMFFVEPEDDSIVKERTTWLIPLAVAAIVLLVIGVYPPPAIDLVMSVARSIL
jgi:NADH:ubiquinone oxidoreductase subunit 2 (subunit N)